MSPRTPVLDANAADKQLSLWPLSASSRTRRFAILFGSALALWMALFLVLPADLPFSSDQNSYIAGAAALKSGHGYRFEPYINLPPIGMYPPGHSIWLACFWKNGQPISANSYRLEIANWLAAGAALIGLACCLFISELPAWLGWALLMSFGTSQIFTQLTVELMSDVLFTAGTCALALLVAGYDSHSSNRKLVAWWLCASLLTGVLCLVKFAAVALGAGLVAFGVWKGDLRRPSRLAGFALPPILMALWLLHTRGVPIYSTFVNVPNFSRLAGHVFLAATFALLYGSERWLVTVLLNVPDRLPLAHAFQHISALAQGLVFILGLVAFALPIFLGIRKGPRQPQDRIVLCLLGAYALELVLWPYHDGPRFGIPVIPFLLIFLWRGLPSKAAQVALTMLLAVNIPGNAWLSYKFIHRQQEESIQSLAELREAANWINASAGTGSLVASGRDVPLAHLYEYLGRRMLANPGPNDLSASFDVTPAAQGNLRADYIVTGAFVTPGQRYHVERRFGHWMVLAPSEHP